MTTKFKRKKYLIDLPFQLKMISRFMAIVVISSFVIGVGVFLFTQSSTTVAIENTRVYVKPTSDFILPVLIFTVLTVAIATALLVMVLTLFISHRIVGPVYRLKNEIIAFRNGSLKRSFMTREKDQLKDLALCLQEMSNKMHSKHVEIKSSYQLLSDYMIKEGASLPPGAQEKLRKLLSDFDDKLNYYKT